MPEGVSLLDLGEHELRDLSRPERVHQVIVPGLPVEAVPLRTTDARFHALPLQATPLLGREQDVQAVQRLLVREAARLVTLTGPGGTGKTRLGLEVAATLLDQFEDGALFVDLAPIADPALVVPTVGRALGVPDAAGRPMFEMVVSHLHGRRLLLLLDNFEQILEAATIIGELLRECPLLSALVTSRAALQISGEREFPVPPLALPAEAGPLTPAHLGQYAALVLFVERAVAIRPEFAVTAANLPAIVELCTRLDGLPLAIELAAARIRLLSPEAMLTHLSQGLALLAGGRRDLPVRQRTLRSAIAWSYNLLPEPEQRLFRRLGVFVGGFTLDAGCQVSGFGNGDSTPETLDLVGALVEINLVRPTGMAEAEPRFGMLETIREYAQEELAASGEREQTQQRHAAYFLALAEQADRALVGAEQAAWLDRLETEHDNLRAVLRRAAAEGDADTGLHLGGKLWRFWWMRGYLTEGRERLDALLVRQVDGLAGGPRDGVRAEALLGAGLLALWQGSYGPARALLQESLGIGLEIGDRRCAASALAFLGRVARDQGDEGTARSLGTQGVALFREIDEPWGLAVALHFLGLAVVRRDAGAARPMFEESADLFRRLGNEWDLAMPLRGLGLVAYRQGDPVTAQALLEEGIERFRRRGDEWSQAMLTHDLAYAVQAQHDLASAAAHFVTSLSIWQKLGNTRGVASCLAGLASITVLHGDAARAAQLFGAAEGARQAGGGALELTDGTIHDGSISAARAALGEAAFAAAWAAGRAQPIREAMATALAAPASGHRAPKAERESPLSRREQEVARLVAQGLTNRQIAEALVITEGTAINHLTHILNKLGFRSRAQIAAWVVERQHA